MRVVFEAPVSGLTRRKESFLGRVSEKFPKMVQWFLTAFEREGLDLRGESLNGARKIVKELCYPTSDRDSKYDCKGAVNLPHSHYYDTAITEAIQKWNSFLTWKEKSGSGKRFPEIRRYAPVLDSQMFDLDLEGGWITVRTGRGRENIHVPVAVPNKSHYEGLDEEGVSSIRFKERDRGFVFFLTQGSSSPERPSPEELGGRPVIGIGLGERNLVPLVAVRSGSQRTEILNAEFFDGSEAKKMEQGEHYVRRELQKQGKSGQIPKRRRKTRDRKKDHCEKIAEKVKDLTEELRAGTVFIGDLKGPKPSGFTSLSRRLNNYPFAKLKEAIKRHWRRRASSSKRSTREKRRRVRDQSRMPQVRQEGRTVQGKLFLSFLRTEGLQRRL